MPAANEEPIPAELQTDLMRFAWVWAGARKLDAEKIEQAVGAALRPTAPQSPPAWGALELYLLDHLPSDLLFSAQPLIEAVAATFALPSPTSSAPAETDAWVYHRRRHGDVPSAAEPDFETATTGTGYLFRADGHGSATLRGLRCPKCKAEFDLPPLSATVKCPKCGYAMNYGVASSVPPEQQRDYCPEKLKPGGRQLHNLQCGFPDCNKPPEQQREHNTKDCHEIL